MADSCGIYAEDIVKNSQGNVGLVLQDAEETSDDESEDELLKKGQILVCWYPSGNEETLSLSKVLTFHWNNMIFLSSKCLDNRFVSWYLRDFADTGLLCKKNG